VPYVIDMTTGRIDVARESPLWPLPTPAAPPPLADGLPAPRP